MKKHLIVIISLLLPFMSFSQNKKPVAKNTTQEVFPIKMNYYDMAYSFTNGYARVGIKNKNYGGKYGFIDKKGKEIIPLIYENVGSFNKDGLVTVQNSFGFWGVVNLQNKIIVPLKYKYIYDNGSDYFITQENTFKYGILDRNGIEIIKPSFDVISSLSKNKFLVKDGNTYKLIDEKQNIIKIYDEPVEALSDELLKKGNNFNYGITNLQGEEILPLKYKSINPYYKGLSKVRSDDGYGFIDNTGKVVIPIKYIDSGDYFSENLLHVETKIEGRQRWVYIDTNDKIVISNDFTKALRFSDGLALTHKQNEIGFINKEGKLIFSTGFNETYPFAEGLARTTMDNNVVYVDKTGKIILLSDITKKPKDDDNSPFEVPTPLEGTPKKNKN